jgi:hypothetical protein
MSYVDENALYTFTFLNLADISTTISALKRGAYEANPIARWLLKRFGVAGLFLLKYFGMGVIVLIGALTNSLNLSIWINNILLSIVVAWNSYVNLRLQRDKNSG